MKTNTKPEEPHPKSSGHKNSRRESESKKKNFLLGFLHTIISKVSKNNHAENSVDLEINGKPATEDEMEVISNFLEFGDKTVEDAMVPRSDLIAIKSDISIEELKKILLNFPHTRTLVYKENLDNVIGFVHIKDLVTVFKENTNFQLKKIIRNPLISAGSTKLSVLLAEMRKKRTHISLVVDEYGGTDGIVTVEDIIEEIFGEINDEHDKTSEESLYSIINSKSLLCSSRIEVEDLEKIIDMKLTTEEDEFDTLGGLVLDKIGKVPPIGTKIDIAGEIELEVVESTPRLVKKVKVTLKNEKHLLKKYRLNELS